MQVGFAYIRSNGAIIVVAIFSKNEASNFTAAQRGEIEKWLRQMEKSFK